MEWTVYVYCPRSVLPVVYYEFGCADGRKADELLAMQDFSGAICLPGVKWYRSDSLAPVVAMALRVVAVVAVP